MAHVTAVNIAPVKGMRIVPVDQVEIGPAGARGDRAFFVREADGRLAGTSRNPTLVRVVPEVAADGSSLALRFPDGSVAEAALAPGEAVETAFYDNRPVPGRVVEGPFAAALSEYLGRPVQLVARDPAARGGDDEAVTLMSEESLAALGRALDGEAPVDGRRFRMTLTISGVEAWEEHGWSGREVRAGEAVLRVVAPTERCAVTTRSPDDGQRDLPVLKALAQLRGKRDVTFGVWLGVVSGGLVGRGDEVVPL